MNSIGGFLKKYLDFTPPEKATARAVAKVLGDIFGEPFSENKIAVRNREAYITTDSVLKSEIVFKKKMILSQVNELVPGALIDIK